MWVLLAFERCGDALVASHPIPGLGVAEVRELLEGDEDDPMYDSYPLSADRAVWAGQRAGVTVDLEAHEYFIEQAPERT